MEIYLFTLLFVFFNLSCARKTLAPHLIGKRSFYNENGIKRAVFEHQATGTKLDYVTNSGICETTPGVNQYSGYFSESADENLWFWFFEARENAATAPLAVWFNGGPGCSSMIGLFQENGPCRFENESKEPSLNPYSWNQYANMLYIDQPVDVGFSYGKSSVNSTINAAPLVWKLIQAFYAQFPQYENRNFGIFTESYGGHYGPGFASYFISQNQAIESGKLTGQKINLQALSINNGWFDAAIQQKAYIDYSYNNSYRSLINATQYTAYTNAYNNHCLPSIKKCTELVGQDELCIDARNICVNEIEMPLFSTGDFDIYDIRAPRNDPNPPSTYVGYLNSSSVISAIGAKSPYSECAMGPYNRFKQTGDDLRSYLSSLSKIVQSGLPTLLWAGDADWICNWLGVFAVAEAVEYPEATAFKSQPVANYTVNGKLGGQFKRAGNLNWLRVYGAGHEVPYYTPELALQVFKQIFNGGVSAT